MTVLAQLLIAVTLERSETGKTILTP